MVCYLHIQPTHRTCVHAAKRRPYLRRSISVAPAILSRSVRATSYKAQLTTVVQLLAKAHGVSEGGGNARPLLTACGMPLPSANWKRAPASFIRSSSRKGSHSARPVLISSLRLGPVTYPKHQSRVSGFLRRGITKSQILASKYQRIFRACLSGPALYPIDVHLNVISGL